VAVCADALPESDFGTTLCSGLTACSSEPCDAESIVSLDTIGRWLLPEVTAKALECLDEGCTNVGACFEAWLAAVFPQ
jgi:hypothetical protein